MLDTDQLRRRAASLERWIRSRVPASGWQRRAIIGGVVAALAVAAVVAVRNLPEGTTIRLLPLVLLAVVTPTMLVLNALEYAAAATLAGRRERLLAALRVSVYSSTANLLPVPGSVVVRVQALRNRGHRGTVALGATASVGVCWISVSLAAAGALLLTSRPLLGSVLLVAATAGFVVCVAWGRRLPAERPTLVWTEVIGIELGKVIVQALRIHLALVTLGASPTVGQSFAVAVSVSVGSAAAFLPAGLGVREAIASALGAMVGLTAGVGLLAILIDRAAGLVMAVPLAALVLFLPDQDAVRLDLDATDAADDSVVADAATGAVAAPAPTGGTGPVGPGDPAAGAATDAAR